MSRKRVLITGGTGFLGKAVAERFLVGGTNAEIVGSGSGDLRDCHSAEKLVLQKGCVVHLAATAGGIGFNRKYPGRLFYDNAMMGMNVIEACRKSGSVEKLIITGSICSYPKFTTVPFNENDLWKGYPEETNAPYGIAKGALIIMSQAYREQYGLNSIVLLPVNLYGPGDRGFFDEERSHVIPDMIRKFAAAKESGTRSVILWGSGKPTREFLYVEDAAEAIFLATERYNEPEPVNIGTGNEVSIAELAEAIRSIVGYYGEVLWDATYPDGQPRRCLDVSKAKDLFGFKSKITYSEGLRRTVEWYLKEKERRNGN